MTKYVLGFLFTEDHLHVALILKNKPDWQQGHLNGIGGKVEPGETYNEAMIREFKEEAGLEITTWQQFLTMKGIDWEVACFRAFVPDLFGVKAGLKSLTDEEVVIVHTEWLDESEPIVSNLNWIIPMCLDRTGNFIAEVTYL